MILGVPGRGRAAKGRRGYFPISGRPAQGDSAPVPSFSPPFFPTAGGETGKLFLPPGPIRPKIRSAAFRRPTRPSRKEPFDADTFVFLSFAHRRRFAFRGESRRVGIPQSARRRSGGRLFRRDGRRPVPLARRRPQRRDRRVGEGRKRADRGVSRPDPVPRRDPARNDPAFRLREILRAV